MSNRKSGFLHRFCTSLLVIDRMSLPFPENMKQVILSSCQVDSLSWWLLPTGTWSQENTILSLES